MDVQTPRNSTYVKLDGNGAVLTSHPGSQMFGRGHPLEKPLFEKISKEKKGTFQAVGVFVPPDHRAVDGKLSELVHEDGVPAIRLLQDFRSSVVFPLPGEPVMSPIGVLDITASTVSPLHVADGRELGLPPSIHYIVFPEPSPADRLSWSINWRSRPCLPVLNRKTIRGRSAISGSSASSGRAFPWGSILP